MRSSSTNPVWLQWGFNVIIGLFGRVEIQANTGKMVEMVCQPGFIDRRRYTSAYGMQMTYKGDYHHSRQHRRVVCWLVNSPSVRVRLGYHGV